MTSSRPYLIRALYEWIIDNGQTPYVVVKTNLPEVYVPQEYISDNKIVLNIAKEAVNELFITNTTLEFYATFSGRSRHVSVPIQAVIAIYPKENSAAVMVFGDEPGGDTPPDNTKYSVKKEKSAKKPSLKIVK